MGIDDDKYCAIFEIVVKRIIAFSNKQITVCIFVVGCGGLSIYDENTEQNI